MQSLTDMNKEKGLSPFRPPFDPYTMNVESEKFPNEVPVFIEVSKESRNKYEWDHDLGALRLDRVLHSAVYYPYDYGFIPQTLCGDGDPLDVSFLLLLKFSSLGMSKLASISYRG